MTEKIKAEVLTTDEIFGSSAYSASVVVTNVSPTELTNVEVDPLVLAGRLLSIEVDPAEAEVSQLHAQQRKLTEEMEAQLVRAYERHRLKNLSFPEVFMFSLTSLIEGYASLFTLRRPTGVFPSWAREALRINDRKDVENLEQHIMANEKDDSFLKKAFLIDKEKLDACISKILGKGEADTALKSGPTLQPGASAAFPFTVRAPHLLRSRHADLQFRVAFRDAGSDKVSSQSVIKRILLYPSSFAVPTGSMLGAACGYAIRLSLVGGAFTEFGVVALNLGGSVLLGLVVALLTSRKPEVTKAITVEDFLGGFLVGALVGIFSQNALSKLGAVFK